MTVRPPLAEALDLRPHPEGGWYRQTWASPVEVMLAGPDGTTLTRSSTLDQRTASGERLREHVIALWDRERAGMRRVRLAGVRAAHVEPAAADRAREHATRIAPVLQDAARWQGLGDIAVAGAGTWAGQIARALS